MITDSPIKGVSSRATPSSVVIHCSVCGVENWFERSIAKPQTNKFRLTDKANVECFACAQSFDIQYNYSNVDGFPQQFRPVNGPPEKKIIGPCPYCDHQNRFPLDVIDMNDKVILKCQSNSCEKEFVLYSLFSINGKSYAVSPMPQRNGKVGNIGVGDVVVVSIGQRTLKELTITHTPRRIGDHWRCVDRDGLPVNIMNYD